MDLPKIFIRDPADIIDRWAISSLKKDRIAKEEDIREYKEFEKGVEYLKIKYPNMEWEMICKLLLDIHDFIWKFESGTKSGKEHLPEPIYIYDPKNEPILSKIGLIGIEIRNYNHLRVAIKNYINKTLGEGFIETKKDHCSEDKQ